MKLFRIVSLLTAIVFLAGCGKTEKIGFTSEELTLIAEGPLFSGSNTMQANYNLDFSGIDTWVTPDHLVNGKIVGIELHNRNTELFSQINAVILSIMSDKHGMKQIGVMNPVPGDESVLHLSVAQDQDITDILKEGKVTFVADVDLKDDLESNLEYQLVCQYEFELKH